jgi:hypothetical protein
MTVNSQLRSVASLPLHEVDPQLPPYEPAGPVSGTLVV